MKILFGAHADDRLAERGIDRPWVDRPWVERTIMAPGWTAQDPTTPIESVTMPASRNATGKCFAWYASCPVNIAEA